MIWKKFTVETTEECEDLVAEFLNEKGAEGVLVEDKAPLSADDLKAMYVDVPLMPEEDDGKAYVSCFLQPDFNIEALTIDVKAEIERLAEFLPSGTGIVTITDTTDDSTWADAYKEYFKPFRLYDDIVIEPTWEELADKKPDDHVIKIESVMSFGTGTHETTKLCIGQIRKYLKPGDSLFDVGCGSGILAFTAVRLGAGYVHGMDIDPQAVKSSYENAAVNGFDADRIGFTCGNLMDRNYITDAGTGDGGSIRPLSPDDYTKDLVLNRGEDGSEIETVGTPLPQKKYDIVVANILAEVIVHLSAKIRSFMKENGLFITSGISTGKADRVKNALLENGFEIVDVIQMNDWVSIVAK